MNKNKKIILISMLVMMIACVSAVSATDIDSTNNVSDVIEVDDVTDIVEDAEIDDVSEDVVEEQETNQNNFQEDLQEINNINQKLNEYDDEYVIYVGHNNKTETGEGTEDNPFSSLKLACENVNGQEKVTVKIFSGTYALGEGYTDATGAQLKFNTNNLNIIGYNGTVTIEPFFLDKSAKGKYLAESFGLTATDGNCTFSNIIFDSSKKEDGAYYFTRTDRSNWFEPFYGSANTVRYDNCSFVGLTGNKLLCSGDYSCQFINCYFDMNSGKKAIFTYPTTQLENFKSLYFDYCYFNMPLDHKLAITMVLPLDVTINNSWFGRNSISNSFVAEACYEADGFTRTYDWMPVINRYVVFSVSENYLGNNQYNITGKLTWNGTDDQDGMENFPQMDVKLMSETGDILASVPLVNNAFSTIYTSTNSNHYITATLGYFSMELEEFSTVNLSVIAPSINYGEDQNITINFTQPITANVTLVVSNDSESKNYTVEINDKNSIVYTLPDTLKAGTYTIEVKLADKHIWGLNSTELTISKIDAYTFNPIVPSEAKVGDVVTIKVELPEDVTGNVIVYVNNNQISKEASKNTIIDISDLVVVGNNNVTVYYEGNDKYENKTSEKQFLPIDKATDYTFDIIVPTGVKVGEDTNITIKLPDDVSGNALVYVGSQDPITVPVSGESTSVPVSGLVAGNNTVKVVFSDDKYAEKSIIKNITVEKVPVEIKNNTIVVNAPTDSATPTVSINIPGATGNLTVIINNKTFTEKLENGTATVTIKDVPAGTYNATVIYSGDNKFDQITTTANITVSEVKKQDTNTNTGGQTKKVTKTATKIVAKKKTFKAKKKVKKYTITLKTKAGKAVKKVWVTLKIKGKKTIKAKTNAKGKATFKIKKLTKKGKYKATIKFKGNKNYKASSKKVKITIKK